MSPSCLQSYSISACFTGIMVNCPISHMSRILTFCPNCCYMLMHGLILNVLSFRWTECKMLDSFTSREKTIILKGQAAKKAVMTKVFALSDLKSIDIFIKSNLDIAKKMVDFHNNQSKGKCDVREKHLNNFRIRHLITNIRYANAWRYFTPRLVTQAAEARGISVPRTEAEVRQREGGS